MYFLLTLQNGGLEIGTALPRVGTNTGNYQNCLRIIQELLEIQ